MLGNQTLSWFFGPLVLGALLAAPLGAEPLRVSPALLARIQEPGGGWDREFQVALRLRAKIRQDAILDALACSEARDIREVPQIRRINARLRADRILDLACCGAVEWIEERPAADQDIDENDGARKAVGLEGISPLPALFQGKGVTIGVWEAGHPDVDRTGGHWGGHDDFSGRIRIMEDSPATQHATGIAGTLAGDGRMSTIWGGLPHQWRGLAPGAELLCYSTSDSDEEAAELLEAIQVLGIQLSLQPWGESVGKGKCSNLGDYSIRAAEFDGLIAGDDPAMAGAGRVPVVFSAGNYQGLLECLVPQGGGASIYPGFRTINPPHTAKNIIAVGAVNSDDLSMTDFSSWGPTDDGRIKPDLVAPGSQKGGDQGITSTAMDPTDSYNTESGTSSSAAVLAGGLAVLMGERADRGAPSLAPAAWKALLVESAIDLTADPIAPQTEDPAVLEANALRFRGPDYFHGHGLVWFPGALRLSLSPDCLAEDKVLAGGIARYGLSFPAGTRDLRVTLAWDDPPGDPAAPKALVNDLDLLIEERLPDGSSRIHQPWVLDPERPDLPAVRGEDRLNNIEVVEIDGLVLGHLTVLVSGFRLDAGPQRFWIAAPQDASLAPVRSLSFLRGDVNVSGLVDISDALTIFGHLFLGSALPCPKAADANGDRRVDIADGIRLLIHLFLDDGQGVRATVIGQCETVEAAQAGCGNGPGCAGGNP